MKTKISCLIILAVCWISISRAQVFQTPENYTLVKASDYQPYESKVIEGVNWMITTPLGQDEPTRTKMEKFLMQWITGAPNVSIKVGEVFVQVEGENNKPWTPDLLSVFLGGMAVFELQHPEFRDQDSIQRVGIESMLSLYQNNLPLMEKDKVMKKFLQLKQDGSLDAWIHNHQK